MSVMKKSTKTVASLFKEGSPKQRLETALGLLISVQGDLNTSERVCSACRCKVFEDFAEKTISRSLEGANGRIRRAISGFESLNDERKGEST